MKASKKILCIVLGIFLTLGSWIVYGLFFATNAQSIYLVLQPRTTESFADLELVCNLFTPASRSIGIYGGDLGTSFLRDNKIFFTLGDVSGPLPLGRFSSLVSDNRHSNAIGSAGLKDFNCSSINWFGDGFGSFLEIIESRRVFGDASTVPTGGISLNGTIYLFMMRMHDWLQKPAEAESILLKSLDDGLSFVEVVFLDNSFSSRFVNVAPILFDGEVYLFGSRDFRKSPIYLAKVNSSNIEDLKSYQFFDGVSWKGSVSEAAPLIDGMVGEFSVQKVDEELFMMYVDYSNDFIVLRRASSPEGPWSNPKKVMSAFSVFGWGETVFGNYYAPYIVPGVSNQSTVYFTVSLWWPYTVNLLKLDLGNETLKT